MKKWDCEGLPEEAIERAELVQRGEERGGNM